VESKKKGPAPGEGWLGSPVFPSVGGDAWKMVVGSASVMVTDGSGKQAC